MLRGTKPMTDALAGKGTMDQRWDAVRHVVCRKCIDGDGRGNCLLPVDDSCALDKFFPTIAETILTVRSASYQSYVDALRTKICRSCDHQFADGVCRKRDTLECALDRYYPLVIDVVESMRTSTVGSGQRAS